MTQHLSIYITKTQSPIAYSAVLLSLKKNDGRAITSNDLLVEKKQTPLTEKRALERSLVLTQINKSTKIAATLDLLHKVFFRLKIRIFKALHLLAYLKQVY